MDISMANLEPPSHYSMDHLGDEADEDEDARLLGGYEREDEDVYETVTTEHCVTNEVRGRSNFHESSTIHFMFQSAIQWADKASNILRRTYHQILSTSSSRTGKQVHRRFMSAIGSLLIFFIPSFIYLWNNDKPQKLHPTAYLDGLRGVAALFVVFHHYACQLTPTLLEGWGTEHDNYWLLQFPVIRVSHNGTLMVEIFFVLSGFVLSVKALKLSRQGRQQEFVKSLASSAFRRWLRLAIPVLGSLTVSLLITRAQLWYPLPLDWQSATPVSFPVLPVAAPVVVADGNSTAPPGAIPVIAPPQNSSTIQGAISTVDPILNSTSVEETLAAVDAIVNTSTSEPGSPVSINQEDRSSSGSDQEPPESIIMLRAVSSQIGGLLLRRDGQAPTQRIQWLSSPVWMAPKDPSLWNQLKGFFGAVSYIVDPFNTNGVPMVGAWPSYDSGVLWTIPVEWSGSMITFIIVLGLAWAKPWPKLFLLVSFATWGYYSGRGVLTQFVSGIILAELTVARDAWMQARTKLPKLQEDMPEHGFVNHVYSLVVQYLGCWRHLAITAFWTVIFMTGLFLGSFPYSKGEKSIGWSTITSVMKENKIDIDAQHLFFAASILIVISLNHCPSLQRIFTTRIAQYLGRISFSIYLLHMQLLWTVGTRLFPLCMQLVGGGETSQTRYTIGMLLAGSIIFPLQFWISDVFCRLVDEKSILFTKWVAGNLLDFGGRD